MKARHALTALLALTTLTAVACDDDDEDADAPPDTNTFTATLNGVKHNLLQQSEPIEFKLVREGEAIYYIGQFDF